MILRNFGTNKETVHDFVNTRKSKVKRRSLPWVNRDIERLMNQRYKALQKWQENRENSELTREIGGAPPVFHLLLLE